MFHKLLTCAAILLALAHWPNHSQAAKAKTKPTTATAPTLIEPLVAVSPISRSRVHLDLGVGAYNQDSFANGTATHLSTAFAVAYEYGSPLFGFNIRIPFGIAKSTPPGGDDINSFLLGDINMRFRWRVMSLEQTKSYLSFGFEVTLPTVLLNSLGGKRFDIQARRLQDPVYQAGTTPSLFNDRGNFNMLPMRYLYIAPQLAFAQQIGKLTFGAHLMGTIIIASDLANLYEYPHVEFILSYDLYAAYDFAKDGLFAAILELNGNSVLTPVATDQGLVDAGTGLNVTIGARSRITKRLEASIGFQYSFPVRDGTPNKEKRGYDLSMFYRHDWSILFRFAVLLD